MSGGLLARALGPTPDLPLPRGLDADRRAAVVLWSAATLLVLLIFRAGFPRLGDLSPAWNDIADRSLAGRLYWAAWGFLLYLAVPVAIVRFVLRESPARYGLRFRLTRRTALAYIALVGVMVPLLFAASKSPAFLRKYPFVDGLGADPVALLMWECVQVARFVCLEFFFRGFLLFGLEEKLGRNAVAASVVPYGIIHYAKPFPEAIAAVVAGAVLGHVARHTRTITGGAIVHSAIAVGMDLVALWRKGEWP